MSEHSESSDSNWVTTFVFIGGFIMGAGAAIFLALEPGAILRERLARGAKTAQEEFGEAATDMKEAIGGLAHEAQRTMKKTATRLNAAVDATKESMISEIEETASEQ